MSDDHVGGPAADALSTRGLAAKREYVRGLERRADPEALSLLVECLCDESWYLRDLAEEAFKRLGPERVHVLLPLLDQGLWFTRASAARTCGQLGHRPAVPHLLRLCDDPNATVVDAAFEAIVAIGSTGGSVAVASALHHLPPDVRERRTRGIAGRDRDLAQRVERLQADEDLMSADAPETLDDEHPLVQASEDGVEWEILTGPSTSSSAPAERGAEPRGND